MQNRFLIKTDLPIEDNVSSILGHVSTIMETTKRNIHRDIGQYNQHSQELKIFDPKHINASLESINHITKISSYLPRIHLEDIGNGRFTTQLKTAFQQIKIPEPIMLKLPVIITDPESIITANINLTLKDSTGKILAFNKLPIEPSPVPNSSNQHINMNPQINTPFQSSHMIEPINQNTSVQTNPSFFESTMPSILPFESALSPPTSFNPYSDHKMNSISKQTIPKEPDFKNIHSFSNFKGVNSKMNNNDDLSGYQSDDPRAYFKSENGDDQQSSSPIDLHPQKTLPLNSKSPETIPPKHSENTKTISRQQEEQTETSPPNFDSISDDFSAQNPALKTRLFQHNESIETASPEHRENIETVFRQLKEQTETAPAEHSEPTETAPAEHSEPTETAPAEHSETTETAPAEHSEPTETALAEHSETTETALAEHSETTETALAEHSETTETALAEHSETTKTVQLILITPTLSIDQPEFPAPTILNYCQESLIQELLAQIREQLTNPDHLAYQDIMSDVEHVMEDELFTIKLPYDLLLPLIENSIPKAEEALIHPTEEAEPSLIHSTEEIAELNKPAFKIIDDFEHDHEAHHPGLEDRVQTYIDEQNSLNDDMEPPISDDLILMPTDPLFP